MIRIEIITNQSVYSELKDNLEACIPNFLYTVIPLVYGRGGDSYKLGDSTWPETNVMLIAYAEDNAEQKVSQVVRYIKAKFPTEGIKMFVLHDSASN
ncbi:MAG: hypothetical protein J6J00_02110 [Treponema sp.]|nr:hypothetical protein [Treponema sp.]